MAVDSTALMREVDAIVQKGQGLGSVSIQVRIRIGNAWFSPIKVDLLDLSRDYEDAYGDVVVLEVIMGQGQYAYQILPNRDNIQVDVTTIPLRENSTGDRSDIPRRVKRYRGVLMEQDNPSMTGRSPQSSSESDLDTAGVKTVQFQLMDEGLYQARMWTVGGLYRNTKAIDVLRSTLTTTTTIVDANNKPVIYGVDVFGDFNTTVREHLIVPHGTPLVGAKGLCNHLQLHEGGLLPTGVGCYLQDGYWKVYPKYDHQRWNKTPKVLTILAIPPNRFAGAERSYRVTTNQVVIVAANQLKSNDPGLYDQLNQGNSVRFADVRNLMSYGETNEGRTTVSRNRNVFEVSGVDLKAGVNNTPWASEGATDNPYAQYTKLARRNGQYVMAEWQYGDSSLLYPGMPVKYMYNANGKLITLHGTLLGVHEQRVSKEGGAIAEQYPASCGLKLFLSRTEVQT